MINTLTVLLFVALVIAVSGLVHQLAIIYFVTPRIVKKYGLSDPRSQLWMAKVEKIHRSKVILMLAVIITYCVLDLLWTAIKVHLFNSR